MLLSTATSYGVPTRTRPPTPAYSPSEFSRTQIMSMSAGPTNLAVVRTIVELAHTLDLHTVAEGIEDAEQLQALVRLGTKIVSFLSFGKRK